MAHVPILVEARKIWMDLFIKDLTERTYPYKTKSGQMGFGQVNVREIKLLDISIAEESIPYLMADLAPFAVSNPHMAPSPLKSKAWLLAKAIRVLTGLKPLSYDYEPSEALRHSWVNVIPIGWKEDLYDPEGTFPTLPWNKRGGELL